MPWVRKAIHHRGLKGRENFYRSRLLSRFRFSRPFRPQGWEGLLTQGVGLRPRPWALISRPVGPDGPAPCVMFLNPAREAGAP
jgi:hypothetical protein